MQYSNKSSGKNINLLNQNFEKNDPNLFLTKLPLKKEKEKSQNSTNFTKNGNITNSEKDEKNNSSSLLSYMNEINKNNDHKSYISKKINEEYLNSLSFNENRTIKTKNSNNNTNDHKNNNIDNSKKKNQIPKSQKPKEKISPMNKVDLSIENQKNKAKNDDTERLKTNAKKNKENSENTKFIEKSPKFDKNQNLEKLFKPQTDKIYEKIKSLKYNESETDNNNKAKDLQPLKKKTFAFFNELLKPNKSLHEKEFKSKNEKDKTSKKSLSPNKSNYDTFIKNISKESLQKKNRNEKPSEILKKGNIFNENPKKSSPSQNLNSESNSNERLSQFFDKISKNKNNNYLLRLLNRKSSTPINNNPCLLSVRNLNNNNQNLNVSEILVRVKRTLSKYKLNQDILLKERENMIKELNGLREKVEFYKRNDLKEKIKNNR